MTNEAKVTSRSDRWIGDLWILAIISIAFLGLSRWQYPGHIRFIEIDRGEVVYSGDTTRQVAVALGRQLSKMQVFDGRNQKTVSLSLVDGAYELRLPIDQAIAKVLTAENSQQNPAVREVRQQIKTLHTEVLKQTPLTVRLTDPQLVPHTNFMTLP